MVFFNQKMMKDWIFGECFKSPESFRQLRRSPLGSVFSQACSSHENQACRLAELRCVRSQRPRVRGLWVVER